jgi:P27 family predicted phage terminase small subunit
MRGRKPKPTETRRLEGNAGHRPLNLHEPKFDHLDESFDTPPAELADFKTAQAEWRRLAPLLRKARQVTPADRGALLALCIEYGRYLDAMARVASGGMVARSPSGYPMLNPYLSIATKALLACNKLWPELGLTPSSRSRVTTSSGAGGADDPFAEFDAPPPAVGDSTH